MADTCTILETQNPDWGFYGTMRHHVAADTAWDAAFPAVMRATGCDAEEARIYLDSRYGRHFADEVVMHLPRDGSGIDAAIATAIKVYKGWKLGTATRNLHGIPPGIDYLTGFVVVAGIEARA